MGFNYLQTDDRDDYFNNLNKNKSNTQRRIISITVLKSGKKVFNNEKKYVVMKYFRDAYVKNGVTGWKKIWRTVARDNGYTIVNNY